MSQLYAGFSRVDITPMLGIGMGGYYIPRFVEGVRDNLEINALALACGEEGGSSQCRPLWNIYRACYTFS